MTRPKNTASACPCDAGTDAVVSPFLAICAALTEAQGPQYHLAVSVQFQEPFQRGPTYRLVCLAGSFPWVGLQAGEKPGVAAAPLAISQPPATPTASRFFGISANPVFRGCNSDLF